MTEDGKQAVIVVGAGIIGAAIFSNCSVAAGVTIIDNAEPGQGPPSAICRIALDFAASSGPSTCAQDSAGCLIRKARSGSAPAMRRKYCRGSCASSPLAGLPVSRRSKMLAWPYAPLRFRFQGDAERDRCAGADDREGCLAIYETEAGLPRIAAISH